MSFELSASVVLWRGQEILVMKRAGGFSAGGWFIPGGHVEQGERPVESAARELFDRLGCPILLKGGHLAGAPVDLLWDGREEHSWRGSRIAGVISHGTGCRLSAGIAARLAAGDALAEACATARAHLRTALENPTELADGRRLAGF